MVKVASGAQVPDELKDWRGTPICVGSRIIYPVCHSSSVYLIEAEVTEVNGDGTLSVKRIQEKKRYGLTQVAPKIVKIGTGMVLVVA